MFTKIQTVIAAGLITSPALAIDYYVHPTGTYSTIQSGIAAASAGDRVLVQDTGVPTTYFEDIDFMGKDIQVMPDPANLNDVTIFGTGTGPVVSMTNGEPITAELRSFRIGGGAAAYGGGILVRNSAATLSDLSIEQCIGDHGAGIALIRSKARLYDVFLIANNEPSLGYYGVEGGGLFADGSIFFWKGGSVNDNRALYGGGLYARNSRMNIVRVEFKYNSSDYGGAACLGYSKSPYLFEDCFFSANTAMLIGSFGPTMGGGVLSFGAQVDFLRCTLENNHNLDGPGGGIAAKGGAVRLDDSHVYECSAHHGGGAYGRSAEFKVQNSHFSGNFAHTNGGAVQVEGSGAGLTAMQSKFSYNSAIRGGAIALQDRSDMYLILTEILENEAELGGGIYAYGKYGTRVIESSYMYGNSAILDGGALFIRHKASFTVTGQSFLEHNWAGMNGGGIFAFNADLLFDASRCCFNNSGGLGGGLRSMFCAPVIQNSIISNNTLADVDGAIVNIASSIGGGC